MKVLLVDNLVLPQEGSLALLDVHPHLGLLALAAVAEATGHSVRIYDPKRLIRSGELRQDATLYENAALSLLAQRPDAVGFTTLGCSFLFAVNVAAILKNREPELPILLGGPHATMLHRQILDRYRQFDVIVRHEADEIFPAVLDHLDGRQFEQIPGISWREPGREGRLRFTDGSPKVDDLDQLPLASYDHYPILELGLSLLRIEAGRGCPFNCTFCSTAGFFQRSYRLKSASRLVRELDLLRERYGFSDFKLDHDMFTVNRRKVMEFCDAVKGRGFRWRASARVDCVDTKLLECMADSGCVGLYFGIETGSPRIQEICKKRLDLDLVEPTLATAERLGIDTTASFITGYPAELEQDQDATLDLLGRCSRESCLVQLHMLAPEPGTPMYAELGDTVQYDGYGGRYNAELVAPDDESKILANPEIFQTYYFYPAEMPRFHYIFAVEAVDLLRRVGPVILHYVLRAYNGQLSILVRELRAFLAAHCPGRAPDSAMIESYVSWRFGAHHHVTSLFRCALRANSTPVEQDPGQGRSSRRALNFDGRYTINQRVHVLHDLHDCGLVLSRIAAQSAAGRGFLDESETGKRANYLLYAAGKDSTVCRIDSGTETILSLFEMPRTCGEVRDLVANATGIAGLEADLFAELIHERILVVEPASTVTRARRAVSDVAEAA